MNKILSINFKNFGPFKTEKNIDFDNEKINFYSITGEMSVGKTKIIKLIDLVQAIIKYDNQTSINKYLYDDTKPFEFEITAQIDGNIYKYKIKIKDTIVTQEQLTSIHNGEIVELFERRKKVLRIHNHSVKFEIGTRELLLNYLKKQKKIFLDIYNFITEEILIKYQITEKEILNLYGKEFCLYFNNLTELLKYINKDTQFLFLYKHFKNVMLKKEINRLSTEFQFILVILMIFYAKQKNKILIIDNFDTFLNYNCIINLLKFETLQIIFACNTFEYFYHKNIQTINIISKNGVSSITKKAPF